MKAKAFPDTLFVKTDATDNGEPIFLADDDLSGADDGDQIAIYRLTSVRRLRITRELED